LNFKNSFGGIKMKSNLMKKCIKPSRIFVSLTVFIILNTWFLFENDPQWIFSIIVSAVAFFISIPSSNICTFLIAKGDKINRKILRILFYLLILPIVFIIFIFIFIVMLLCAFIVEFFFPINSISLGAAVLIAFTGIGILTCVLVPYYQTIIILILRYFLSLKDSTNK
jgi:hypothetical protein